MTADERPLCPPWHADGGCVAVDQTTLGVTRTIRESHCPVCCGHLPTHVPTHHAPLETRPRRPKRGDGR